MATKAEELEQFVALGTSDVVGDMTLRCLIGMHAEVLSPRVAVERVVGLPLLTELVNVGIATTVDAIKILVAVGAFDEGSPPYCPRGGFYSVPLGGRRGGYVALALHVVGGGRLLPYCDEPLVVDGADFVDSAVGTIRLNSAWVIVRGE